MGELMAKIAPLATTDKSRGELRRFVTGAPGSGWGVSRRLQNRGLVRGDLRIDTKALLAKLVSICIDFFASDDINTPNYGDTSRPPCTRVFTA